LNADNIIIKSKKHFYTASEQLARPV